MTFAPFVASSQSDAIDRAPAGAGVVVCAADHARARELAALVDGERLGAQLVIVAPLERLAELAIVPTPELSRARMRRALRRGTSGATLGDDPAGPEWLHLFFIDGRSYRYERHPGRR